MEKSTILIVDDDEDILEANSVFLQHHGYHILKSSTIREAKESVENNNIDLIILDIVLPDGSGINLCEEIRCRNTIPIIFLSCLAERPDIVQGLLCGGDDYLTKPYSLDELAARCVAILRRINSVKNKPTTIAHGPLRLDMGKQIAFFSDEDILLTPKEFNLLLALVQNQSKCFTTNELYDLVWGQNPIDGMRTVQVHICNLRKKLKMDCQSVVEIEMIDRKYYRLNIHK